MEEANLYFSIEGIKGSNRWSRVSLCAKRQETAILKGVANYSIKQNEMRSNNQLKGRKA